MGRKKSKTSKKKHAKAASLASSTRKHKSASKAFGVTVSTGGSSTKPPHGATRTPTNDTRTSLDPRRGTKKGTRRHRLPPTKTASSPTPNNTERKEFEAECASLHRRHESAAVARKQTKHVVCLAPPTLRTGNDRRGGDVGRPTEELVAETVGRLSRAIKIGAPVEALGIRTPIASFGGMEEEGGGGCRSVANRNKFWALQEDDSDEDGDGGGGEETGRFRFTPARFAVPSSTIGVLAAEFDPDL